MAEQQKVQITISFAWWLQPYLTLLIFFCLLHRSEPDYDRLGRVIARAVRLRTH